MAFDIDCMMTKIQPAKPKVSSPVYIAGLARAGTTILLEALYSTGAFTTLTYRDMPFVLSPNLWRSLNRFSRKSKELEERAHGDGLLVNFDSPEALEEVFWKSQCGADYILDNCLIPMTADDETIEDFRNYVSLILKDHTTHRYLSKNNNNIIRLNSISKAFLKATILVPFRQPEQQAYSLLRQHQRFCELHSTDHFSKKYMTWLVHHEFGSDHRPFVLGEHQLSGYDPDSLNYWLELWLHTYTYLSENVSAQVRLVCYETLCEDGEKVWGELAEHLEIGDHRGTLTFSGSYHKLSHELDEALLDKARLLYEQLRTQAVGTTSDN
jgi:hypothetical protein